MGQGGRTGWRTVAAPFLWLFLFFVVTFGLILKISLSVQARARPPYLPQLDLTTGLSGIWEFLSGLDLENFATLLSDSFYVRPYLLSVHFRL